MAATTDELKRIVAAINANKRAISDLQDTLAQLRNIQADIAREVEAIKVRPEVKQSAAPKVQKILVTNALATGVAFGIGLIIAPIMLAIVLAFFGGIVPLLGGGPTPQPPRTSSSVGQIQLESLAQL